MATPNPMPLIASATPKYKLRLFTGAEHTQSRLAWKKIESPGLDVRILPLTPEQSEVVKRLDCELYVRCLDYAAGKEWEQFHCQACASYRARVDEEEERQLAAFAAMLRKDQGEELD